jgi:tyrosine-protein kinase Etk/Wzc
MNSPQTPLPPQFEVEEVRLSDYLNVLLRRRRIFLLAFLAVSWVFYTFTMQPIYEASATCTSRTKNAKGGSGEWRCATPTGGRRDRDLKSRTNAEEVVKRLHSDWGSPNE